MFYLPFPWKSQAWVLILDTFRNDMCDILPSNVTKSSPIAPEQFLRTPSSTYKQQLNQFKTPTWCR